MEAATQTRSFAQQHAEPSKGFNAVPRWFRRTSWWKSLRAEHRAIIDELYHQIRRLPLLRSEMSFDIGTDLKRGQCAISLDKLAEGSGATKQQVRTALQHAEKVGIIRHDLTRARAARSTHAFSLFTWVDFDLYDIADSRTNMSVNMSANTTPNTTSNITANTNNTLSSIHISEDTTHTQERREVPSALPPNRFAQGGSPTGPDQDGVAGRINRQRTAGRKSKSPKRLSELQPSDLSLVCASHDAMTAYLLFGMDGVREPDQGKRDQLPPSDMNWRHFVVDRTSPITAEKLGIDSWEIKHFAAFFWFRVSFYRQERGIPQTLPNWGRLFKHIESLLQTMPKWEVFLYLHALTDYFDLACCIGGNHLKDLTLDENQIVHSSIKNAVTQLRCASGEQMEIYFADFRAQIAARNARYKQAA